MKCFNCKIEIPQVFGFALSQNKCPACGKEILDEETRALKSDMINYIGNSITLKPETLDKLSMMLISRYDIQGISSGSIDQQIINTRKQMIQEASMEIQEPEVYDTDKEIEKLQEKRNREMENKELDELKGEALKEALAAKYNLSFGEDAPTRDLSSSSPTDFGDEELPFAIRQKMGEQQSTKITAGDVAAVSNNADFGDINPILEAARLKNKVKTARAMEGGGDASFRRTV